MLRKEKEDRQAIIEEAKQEIPYVIDIPRRYLSIHFILLLVFLSYVVY